MKTTEVLTPEALVAMPDAELLMRLQRLRRNVDSLEVQLAEARGNPYGRRTDWTISADSRRRDFQAALDQAREEGARRLRAARGQAA